MNRELQQCPLCPYRMLSIHSASWRHFEDVYAVCDSRHDCITLEHSSQRTSSTSLATGVTVVERK
ncbi:hypothetical protein DICVIV_00597 [Dictyocaulus viviparus]|uniref:Uncharacterized protein n=1 Tax=Dictyocaulus viviparus TaxID=29172 RepID=A0A0D8YF71_DICVI|nr:hypothetical protein DICVIV_00597 [Dictyocaulus viviparus]